MTNNILFYNSDIKYRHSHQTRSQGIGALEDHSQNADNKRKFSKIEDPFLTTPLKVYKKIKNPDNLIDFSQEYTRLKSSKKMAAKHFRNEASALLNFREPFSLGSANMKQFVARTARNINEKPIGHIDQAMLRGIKKYQKALQSHGIPEHFALKTINPKIGVGIFLNHNVKPFKQGQLIGIYSGQYEVVQGKDKKYENAFAFDLLQEVKLKNNEVNLITGDSSILDTTKDYVIKTNALKAGNFCRFINHSLKDYNAKPVLYTMPDGTIEILIVAARDLKPGDQILMSYGELYWKQKRAIPFPMQPETFVLDSAGEILQKKLDPFHANSLKVNHYLIKFRRTLARDDLHVLNRIRTFEFPVPDTELIHKIRNFCEDLNERGIPSRLTMQQLPDSKRWAVFLKPSSRMIKKGEFVAIYSGSFELSSKCKDETETKSQILKEIPGRYIDRKTSDAKTTRFFLKINADSKGNFTREIQAADRPNLERSAYLFKNNEPQLILTAKWNIQPGELLSIEKTGPLHPLNYTPSPTYRLDLDGKVQQKN